MSDTLERTIENNTAPSDVGGVAAQRLQAFVDRIERLEAEEQGLKDDKKDIYLEAKGTGFDVKVLRIIIRKRKKSREERQEEEEVTGLYMQALGMDV